MKIYSYRTNLTSGEMPLPKNYDLSTAFNRIASMLSANGLLMDLRILGKCVRIEGRVKIGRRNYPAVMQGTLIVVDGQVDIPDIVEVHT